MSRAHPAWVKTPPAASLASFFRPRWLVVHIVLLGSAAAMVFLGRWQLHVSEGNGFALQNTSYIVQWWAFAAYAVFFWARLIRDARRPPAPTPSPSGEVVLRSGSQALARSGPAQLSRTDKGGTPVAYRGYVLPDSSKVPHRSYGDDHHNAYNDYLWQLSLADQAGEAGPVEATPATPDAVSTTPQLPAGGGKVVEHVEPVPSDGGDQRHR